MPQLTRRNTPELMDAPDADPAQLASAFRFIRLVNRRLGGSAALLTHLKHWSKNWPTDRPITLVDLGAGAADIPIAAVRWARKRGYDLHVTAIDNHSTTLEQAAEHLRNNPDAADAITLLNADALTLTDTLAPKSFDYAHAGMFLHHLSNIEILTVLRVMERLATKGIVWNDLIRSRSAYAAVCILTTTLPTMPKHDARVSVLKGFTRSEVTDFANRLDMRWCRYRVHHPWMRFTLAGEKPNAWKDI